MVIVAKIIFSKGSIGSSSLELITSILIPYGTWEITVPVLASTHWRYTRILPITLKLFKIYFT